MTQVQNRKEFEAWLKEQDRWVSVAMAARIGLRVLPKLGPVIVQDPKEYSATIVLPVFRAIAVPWVAGTRPTQGTEFRAAYAADAAAAAYAAVYAAYAAAAAYAAVYAADADADAAAVYAADAAAAAYAAYAAAAYVNIWEEIHLDIAAIETGATVEQLMERPLWGKMPDDVKEHWQELKQALLGLDENWQVWTQWYEDRLISGPKPNGRPVYYPLEKERVLIPDEDWEKGPAHVNGLIARIEERYRGISEPSGQQAASLEFERKPNGKIGRQPLQPQKAEDEEQAEIWREAWEGIRFSFDDLLEMQPARNLPRLQPILKRYDRALSQDFDDMSVVQLGQMGQRLLELLNRNTDMLSDDVTGEISALLASHHDFIRQMPRWQKFLAARNDDIGKEDVALSLTLGHQSIEEPEMLEKEAAEDVELSLKSVEDVLDEGEEQEEWLKDKSLPADHVRSMDNLMNVSCQLIIREIREKGNDVTQLDDPTKDMLMKLCDDEVLVQTLMEQGARSEFAWLIPLLHFIRTASKAES
ncbi:hypothetical protein [Terasakiella sp. SH-1]|uniref:hypothetical protein n=1 Tax=Terasakiella sp. SH-1 TaxID=2560057 RepID=UPI00143203A4|nr:hypothetical protein [Terasakiella sp. SH-1]